MRHYHGQVIFSASDLVIFLGCRHATVLDRRQLDAPVPLANDDAYLQLLQQKGLQHELAYCGQLRAQGRRVVDISNNGALEERAERTREAMLTGADVIYQGAFLSGRWQGYADFSSGHKVNPLWGLTITNLWTRSWRMARSRSMSFSSGSTRTS